MFFFSHKISGFRFKIKKKNHNFNKMQTSPNFYCKFHRLFTVNDILIKYICFELYLGNIFYSY